MSPYPPGVSAGTPNAPWNQEPAEECEFCGGTYTHGGHRRMNFPEQCECVPCGHYWEPHEEPEVCPECGSDDIGGVPCPEEGVGSAERAEQRREMNSRSYDDYKEDQMFD